MGCQRLLVQVDGLLQFTFHLLFIGLLEELPRLALVFFAAFARIRKSWTSMCRDNVLAVELPSFTVAAMKSVTLLRLARV